MSSIDDWSPMHALVTALRTYGSICHDSCLHYDDSMPLSAFGQHSASMVYGRALTFHGDVG